MKKRVFLWLGILLIVSSSLRGELREKTGTTGFVFLKIPASARYIAMGETGIALPNVGSDAIFVNPALASLIPQNNALSFSYGDWYLDTRHQTLSYTRNLNLLGSVGVHVLNYQFGEMTKTRVLSSYEADQLTEGDNNKYRDLGTFTAGAYSVGMTYARQLTDKFSIGTNLKYVRETIDVYSADNLVTDIGFIFFTGYKSLRVGAFLQNFGLETEYVSETFKMPQTMTLGVSGDILGSYQSPSYLSFTLEAKHPNDESEKIHAGLEGLWNNMITLRCGYKLGSDYEKLTIGMGIRFVFQAKQFQLDMAYMNHEYLQSTMRYTLSMEL
ncbi:MAG: PorV/PorQ family protein [Fidelibacterota bacterium]